jgi:Fic family protein
MKTLPPTPSIDRLFKLPIDAFHKIAQASATLQDNDYLHWDALRFKTPPNGLTAEEWWLALKLKRSSNNITMPLLLAKNGDVLSVARHAKIEAGVARMDRTLAGHVVMHELTRNHATRDQFIASSLMEEAIHSSLFEGAVSTRETAKDMLRSGRKPINRDERMILNNYRAMVRIREMAKAPLTLDSLLELHRILTDGTLDKPEEAGRIQQVGDVRVHIVDDKLHRVIFEPPPAEQLAKRLENLIAFANADEIVDGQYTHPVVRAILLHFQLAYDHPFYDGNGRTARTLFYWSMLRRGYWLAEYLSISRLLYQKRQPYELAYLQVESDKQDSTYFVLQQLDVLERAVLELFDYVGRKSFAQQQLKNLLNRRDDLNHRQLALLDHALRKPDAEYTHESHANSHRISIMTARNDILILVKRGWIQKIRRGKRFFYHPAKNLDKKLVLKS